jgi:dipeptidyl aminopeptidase/acylaminoacyl peptidase
MLNISIKRKSLLGSVRKLGYCYFLIIAFNAMKTILSCAAVPAACVLVAGAALAQDASPIPVEKFFQNPAITGARISPDGRHVVLRMLSEAGRSMLAVVDVQTHAQTMAANFSNADVSIFEWVSDKRLVYTLTNVEFSGEIRDPGVYAVDRDGKDFQRLSTILLGRRSFADTTLGSNSYAGNSPLGGLVHRQSESIYIIAGGDRSGQPALLSTHTGKITILEVPSGATRLLPAEDGELRIAVTRRDGHNILHYKEAADWREIGPADNFTPMLYTDGTLYVQARNGNNESSIYRYDLQKQALMPKPVITAPGYDIVGNFVLNEHKALGFRTITDSENTVWIDPARKAMQDEVDAILPNTINTLSAGAHSETPYILVNTHRDTQDHLYMLYNRDTKQLLRLGAAHADLDVARMTPMTMVRYPARDGMQIPAYVSVPDRPSKKPLPTVVLVGDSQWSRSAEWHWNAEVQFLASRGYVVLQPEPRGVSGFGKAHEMAGKKQWGRAVQDDIADAVKWAVAQGYTDPARVCIAGTGYGGYAAMMGLIRDPALFKCGVSWSGITDIGAMFERNWTGSVDASELPALRADVGDPGTDAAQFKEVSPRQNAARITQPVLLAYGKKDLRVPFREGRKFYEAVAATNPRAEWLEYKPSVEDWKTQANRIDLWRHIEAFLSKNIGQ